jgi:hypothetical protein
VVFEKTKLLVAAIFYCAQFRQNVNFFGGAATHLKVKKKKLEKNTRSTWFLDLVLGI